MNGDLKADHVLVKITAPTLNTHLTSKLYVDTALIGKQNTLTSQSILTCNELSTNGDFVVGGILTQLGASWSLSVKKYEPKITNICFL